MLDAASLGACTAGAGYSPADEGAAADNDGLGTADGALLGRDRVGSNEAMSESDEDSGRGGAPRGEFSLTTGGGGAIPDGWRISGGEFAGNGSALKTGDEGGGGPGMSCGWTITYPRTEAITRVGNAATMVRLKRRRDRAAPVWAPSMVA